MVFLVQVLSCWSHFTEQILDAVSETAQCGSPLPQAAFTESLCKVCLLHTQDSLESSIKVWGYRATEKKIFLNELLY